MTDPYGRPGGTGRPPGGMPTWVAVGLPVAVALLVVLTGAVFLVLDGRDRPDTQVGGSAASGSRVPSSELEGHWTGEGQLTLCAGFDAEGCSGRQITLTIDCPGGRCAVTPFDRFYGSPPLRFEEGVYRASGPVPADVAPICGGAPTSSALWRLELVVRDGRLGGSYQESTIQGFDCGATAVAWRALFERT
ncbi:hypothetical protein FHU33_3004 [Blastococcus colisei]|uniref:Uncharacterized protein n=1 Tax=Blastococcus colisei TaxID=1564162 RepID=A0A543PHJ9_9ACTN|nr:hypothetical protein [Blastococcus colisei]TQN43553.1 hypothetical protein FHU33_3004 [Blastococcus colisei]